MNEAQLAQLKELYRQYNEVIKVLLIEVELRYEKLPTPIHNELRSFNDHIARCYRPDATEDSINKELNRASGHIKRTIFDCFKFLNVALSDFYKDFANDTKNIDLTSISNGQFHITYNKLVIDAQAALRNAKKLEANTENHNQAFEEYEKAFGLYSDLENLINDNVCNINWANAKYKVKTLGSYSLALITFFLGAIVSALLEDPVKSSGSSILTYIASFFIE